MFGCAAFATVFATLAVVANVALLEYVAKFALGTSPTTLGPAKFESKLPSALIRVAYNTCTAGSKYKEASAASKLPSLY